MSIGPILPSSQANPAFIFCNMLFLHDVFSKWEGGRIHTLIPPCAHARSGARIYAVCVSSHPPIGIKKDKEIRIIHLSDGWEDAGRMGGSDR